MSKNIREININQIKIHDPFWSAMQHRMTDTVIPFQEKVLNDEAVSYTHLTLPTILRV